MNVVIVDYGMGNIRSVQNMLRKVGVDAKLSSELNDIQHASHLILPGVGHFHNGMSSLDQKGLSSAIVKAARSKVTKILGICLGMQLLADWGDEGDCAGLGLIPGRVRPITDLPGIQQTQNMGWDFVDVTDLDDPLFSGIDRPRFYFVHGYFFSTRREMISSEVAGRPGLVASVRHENVLGVQFHPEKSHYFGLKIFQNFLGLNCVN